MYPRWSVIAAAFLMSTLGPMARAGTPVTAHAVVTGSAQSPLAGTWSLDTSRMAMPPGQRPKSVTFSFADKSDGTWAIHVDILYATGEQVHSDSRVSPDGTYAPITNSPEADQVALSHPVPGVLVMALRKGDILVSTRVYAVTSDRNHLVETAVYPGSDNQQVMRTNYFERSH